VNILVTGAGGFVGTTLTRRLAQDREVRVRALVRRPQPHWPAAFEQVVGDIADERVRSRAVVGMDLVVHLAARVHVMRDTAADPLEAFRRVNVGATIALAQAAAAAGVTRFIFLSSVKVHGEEGRFTELDAPAPTDAYATSKLEAELALRALTATGAMEDVIIRPPLVYGPNVRANFDALIRAVRRGIPLPFGAVRNRRSLISVDNIADAIVRCTTHPAAARQTFLVSDGEDLSTPELIRRLAAALDRPARLFSVPPAVLSLAAACVGRADMAQRLLGTLCVDVTKARQVLDWVPPVPVDDALARTVRSC
jgi:nucleoside-diphosphate-sugar epimerase